MDKRLCQPFTVRHVIDYLKKRHAYFAAKAITKSDKNGPDAVRCQQVANSYLHAVVVFESEAQRVADALQAFVDLTRSMQPINHEAIRQAHNRAVETLQLRNRRIDMDERSI